MDRILVWNLFASSTTVILLILCGCVPATRDQIRDVNVLFGKFLGRTLSEEVQRGQIDWSFDKYICQPFLDLSGVEECFLSRYVLQELGPSMMEVTLKVTPVDELEGMIDLHEMLKPLNYTALHLKHVSGSSVELDQSSLSKLKTDFYMSIPDTETNLIGYEMSEEMLGHIKPRLEQMLKNIWNTTGKNIEISEYRIIKPEEYLRLRVQMELNYLPLLVKFPENWPLTMLPFGAFGERKGMIFEYRSFPDTANPHGGKSVLQFDLSMEKMDFSNPEWIGYIFGQNLSTTWPKCYRTKWFRESSKRYERWEIEISHPGMHKLDWKEKIATYFNRGKSPICVNELSHDKLQDYYYELSNEDWVAVLLLDLDPLENPSTNCSQVEEALGIQCHPSGENELKILIKNETVDWYSNLKWLDKLKAFKDVYNVRFPSRPREFSFGRRNLE